MGTAILRGISTALLVTVLTLLAGMLWIGMGMGGLSSSGLVDIGLIASCLIGGYRTGRESGHWIMGGIAGAGYVTVSATLLALFLPLNGWGVVQVVGEGALLGIIAGVFGAVRGNSPGVRSIRRLANLSPERTFQPRDWGSGGYRHPISDWSDYREEEEQMEYKQAEVKQRAALPTNANSRWWEEEIPRQS